MIGGEVAGPTGSGKTATLYAAINRLDRDAIVAEALAQYRAALELAPNCEACCDALRV